MNNQRSFNNEDISCQLSVAEEQMYHTQQMCAVGDTSESSSQRRPFKKHFFSYIFFFFWGGGGGCCSPLLAAQRQNWPKEKKPEKIFGTQQIFEAIWREMTYENYERIVRLQFERTWNTTGEIFLKDKYAGTHNPPPPPLTNPHTRTSLTLIFLDRRCFK